MKPIDPEKILFRLNLVTVVIVFILLAPTTRVFAHWFPDKNNMLWCFPLAILGISALLWFVMRLSIPLMIRLEFYHDRRTQSREEKMSWIQRFLRISIPMGTLILQIGMLILLCMSLISFMRGESFDNFLSTLPYSQASMRKPMHG